MKVSVSKVWKLQHHNISNYLIRWGLPSLRLGNSENQKCAGHAEILLPGYAGVPVSKLISDTSESSLQESLSASSPSGHIESSTTFSMDNGLLLPSSCRRIHQFNKDLRRHSQSSRHAKTVSASSGSRILYLPAKFGKHASQRNSR
jgi:hypothetical protein